MEKIEIKVQCPVFKSFRVAQVGGMFDVPVEQKTSQTFCVESPPSLAEDWNVGLIVGASGSGKSTVARHLYLESIYSGGDWDGEKAVIDGFGDMSTKDITRLFTSVGFSSPPSWIKPYHVLSNGEKFRCDLARSLSQPGLVVFDEYTSVVDRNVAKIGSAAISKGIKSGKIDCRFVAVTCHYDVMDWLEPDWVLDMATGTIARRRLRRPEIQLGIYRCPVDAWKLFGKHHYLNASLHRSARCYLATWNGEPVAFCGILPSFGRAGLKRVSRIVTLPDYQGVGIGGRFLDAMGMIQKREGFRLSIVGSHPSIISHCKNSLVWRCKEIAKSGFKKQKKNDWNRTASTGRAVVAFEYIGP